MRLFTRSTPEYVHDTIRIIRTEKKDTAITLRKESVSPAGNGLSVERSLSAISGSPYSSSAP